MKKALNFLSFIITLLFVFSCSQKTETETTSDDVVLLELILDGKDYDELTLEITDFDLPQRIDRTYYVEGKKQKNNRWTFEIPDSINRRARVFTLKYQPFNFESKIDSRIAFKSIVEGDSLSTGWLLYDEKMNPIRGTYLTQEKSDFPSIVVGDSIYVEDSIIQSDIFFVDLEKYPQTELEAIMNSYYFGIYHFKERDNEGYDKDLARTIKIAQKYPYSKYLLSELASFKGPYQDNKDDFRKVYNVFTNTEDEDVKFYNDIIQDFLGFDPQDFLFENVELENSLTGNKEMIITTPDKYNLIVFSASWCKGCHKVIPLLKEIYLDKKDQMEMVYITIDEPKLIDSWKKILEKEEIPWRSLSLLNDEHRITQEYALFGVPYMMLISPDGKGKIFNVYTEEDKKELYKLLEAK